MEFFHDFEKISFLSLNSPSTGAFAPVSKVVQEKKMYIFTLSLYSVLPGGLFYYALVSCLPNYDSGVGTRAVHVTRRNHVLEHHADNERYV